MGYERPHADDHLWWLLLLAFLAGWVMHAQPWNSELLRGLLRDPVGTLTHRIPATPHQRGDGYGAAAAGEP